MRTPESDHYVLLCDRVFDTESRAVRERCVEVRGGRFARIEDLDPSTGAGSTAADDREVFDLRGKTVLPPLVDPHVHLFLDPWPLAPRDRETPGASGFESELEAARARATDARLAGVGVVRDLGDPLGVNLALAEEAVSNTELPRVQAAGPAVHREGRYGRFLGTAISDRDSLRAKVRSLVEDPGVGVLKLVPTGIIDFREGRVTKAPQLDGDDLELAVGIAHDAGKRVSAHASGDDGIRLAVEAGVDFIEHGYGISRQTMDLLVEKDLAWTPTFAPVHVQWRHYEECGWEKAVRDRLRDVLDRHAEMLRYAHSIGACVLPGSDAGSPGVGHGRGLWLELELMQEAGYPAADLLGAAAGQSAARLGVRTGIIEGAPADFVVADGAVDDDVREIRDLRWVARDGQVTAIERDLRSSTP